ncbi:MAG: hypothetical protein IPO92_10035 [Saprospiraceae bacterium]|nr:hypothetical protein [Saprospiraceae bacterium]
MSFNYWQDFEENEYYHIYNKAINGITLFKCDQEYVDFLFKYKKYVSPCFNTYAYCLMPNHFHFLIRVKQVEVVKKFSKTQKTKKALAFMYDHEYFNDFISDQFKRMFSSVAIRYKNRYNHKGAVFIEKYKRIQSQDIFKNIYWLTYIHHNPIHHHYTKEYSEWIYSSYNTYIINSESEICREEVYEWFGGKQYFLQYHDDFKYVADEFE